MNPDIAPASSLADLGLSRRERQTFERLTTVVDVPAGTMLCRQGEVPRQAMILLGGSASVIRGGVQLAEVGAGDIVGELALVDGVPYRSADIVASTDVCAAVMTAREFSTLRRNVPAFTTWVERVAKRRREAVG